MLDPSRERALNEALLLMHVGYRELIAEPDQLLARHGLGRAHHRVLFAVGCNHGASVGDILALLRVSKQALNGPLRTLIKHGWIESAPSPSNRRVKQLRLTERGAELEAALSGNQRDRFRRVFNAVGPEAEHAWREVMRLLAEN